MNDISFDLKSFLQNAPNLPGVYQMFDKNANVLYVGKARNLKKRLASYFTRTINDTKTQTLLEHVKNISITLTKSDNEALLLESNLIKQFKPRYNILLRDDKSYPFLYLTAHQDFPRLDFHRGSKQATGLYFGPYPSAGAVRETLTLLQKLFKLRQCSDSFFANRSRPCLQYHIKRCTAPCVGYIDAPTYQENVKYAVLFLEGKNNQVIDELASKMDKAALALEYEMAARVRDQIVSLRRIQEKQYITSYRGDTDVVALASRMSEACIHVLTIRGGQLIGTKSYFPNMPKNTTDGEILSAFLPQYYLNPIRSQALPSRVLLNIELNEREWIQDALSEKLGKRMIFSDQCRGKNLQWLKMARANAEHTLESHLAGKASVFRRMEALQQALNLTNIPQRMECFDVSHTSGEATVASCVVFNSEGPLKKDYRRFNIEGVVHGDDYAALRQALTRRYTRIKTGEGELPDVLFIDGGKGQLRQGEIVLEELQISGVMLVSIAKGEGRKPGLETLFISGREQPLKLSHDSLALHLIQQIRDEAHRFAITAHRKKRAKVRSTSVLEEIEGIGAKRRKELLSQFGGIQELKRASVEDIAKVQGISLSLAQKIFDALHR
ncbi:MAG: excinuclease ABC subunit UvrC [Gammaproteobacteria bacterium]|nr:excinuclease ABC subunit UvrC [Gammaproteobacteria bacterium]